MFVFPINNSIEKIEDGIKWNNTGASVNWSHVWGGMTYSSFLLSSSIYNSYSFSEWAYPSPLPTIELTDDNQIEDITIQLNNISKLNSSHTLEFGFFYNRYLTKFISKPKFSAIERSLVPERGILSSIYFQDKLNTDKPLNATIGFRVSNYDLTSDYYINPRASLTYAFTDWFTLKGSAGQYTQFLHRFSNNFMIGGKKFVWIQSNEQLRPLTSQQFDIEFQHENDYWTTGVSVYQRKYNNLLDFSRLVSPMHPYLALSEGSDQDNLLMGSGNSKGLELFLHKKSGPLHGWLSYTFGKIEHLFPELNNGKPFLADHDRTHEFKAVAITSPGTWNITLSCIFSSGKTYTPRGRKIEPGTGYVLIHSIIPEDSSANRNTERLDPIQRIDLSITKHLELFSSHWELGFSIFNLFNKKNISHTKFVDSDGNILPTEVHMLGITSTFHIHLSL